MITAISFLGNIVSVVMNLFLIRGQHLNQSFARYANSLSAYYSSSRISKKGCRKVIVLYIMRMRQLAYSSPSYSVTTSSPSSASASSSSSSLSSSSPFSSSNNGKLKGLISTLSPQGPILEFYQALL
jgi:hypothetical protein